MAREGTAKVAATAQSTAGAAAVVDALADAGMTTAPANEAAYKTALNTQVEAALVVIEAAVDHITGDVTLNTSSTLAENRADIAALSTAITTAQKTATNANATTLKTQAAALAKQTAMLDAVNGTAGAGASHGVMTQYAEVNAAVSASVATDMGWNITMGASLDVGNGYDFADDDGFDGRTVGAVSLDTISIDFGAGGVLSLNDNDFAHLVDADDDAAADLMYTNTFGTASFSLVADIDDGDSDTKASEAAGHVVSYADGSGATAGVTSATDFVAAVAADVQWSAKVSMPIVGTNVYFAADEAGGDAYGVSGTYMGLDWSVDSKREALAKDTGAKRSNTVGVSYEAGALTLGATYDSIKDGDQWGVSADYAAGALTMNLSTDEGSDWSASGAYALGSGASLVAGTNYTEDAYVGVSFAF